MNRWLRMTFLTLLILPLAAWSKGQENLKELLIVSSEKKALEQVNLLIRKHKGTHLEPELLLRKGVLYQRRGKSARYFDFERSESEGAMSMLPPELKDRKASDFVRQAIRVFMDVQRRYPKFHRRDEIFFNIAFSWQQLGEFESAKKWFLRLCNEYPSSALVAESYLAAGEIDYENKKFRSALENYRKVAPVEGSFTYSFSLYKSGWSLYNLQKESEGLEHLEKVVALSRREGHTDLEKNLRTEALRDMVLFFAELHPWSKAIAYFRRQAREEAPTHVLRLGQLYRYRDQLKDMDQLYHQFLDEFSGHEKVGDVYVELVDSSRRQKDFAQVIQLMGKFQQACLQVCLDTFLKTSQKYSVDWHKSWRNTKNRIYAKNAVLIYEMYLEVKKAGLIRERTRFQLAELLFEMQLFERASQVYEAVALVIADPLLAHDAPYGAIVSLEKSVEGKSWTEKSTARFHGLVDLYLEKNPQGKYRLDLLFKKGLMAYERQDLVMASELFFSLGQSATENNEKIVRAQDMYLDILNRQKDFAKLAKVAGEWGEQAEKLKKPKRFKELKAIAVQAEFAAIEDQRKKGQLKQALIGYRQFVERHQQSPLIEKARWNQIRLLLELRRSREMAQAGLRFSELHPKSQFAKEALQLATTHFEKSGWLEKAASSLERLAVIEKKPQDKNEYLLVAAQFYQLTEQRQQAERLYKEVSKIDMALLKKDAKLLQQYEKAVFQRYEMATEKKAILEKMKKSPSQELAAFVSLLNAREEMSQKKYSEAFRFASQVVSRKSVDNSWRAEARWIQAQILKGEFVRQSVNTKDIQRLPLVLAIKTEKLQKAQKAFQATIRYGDPEFAAKSYLELGRIYTEYVRSLSKMRLPEGLNEAEQESLQAELQKLILPMEDQSAQSYAEGLKFVEQNGVFTAAVADLETELREVNMQPPPRVAEKLEVQARLMMPEWRAPQ